MLEALKEKLNQLKKASISLILAFVVVLTLAIFSCFWALSSNYGVLFSNLSPEEASKITQKLDELKVNYKLKYNGEEILVDEALVSKLRLQLMRSDIGLNNHVGFELFDKNDLGMTDFTQKINYQRALQGELERTISGLDEIKNARVHLVMPQNSLFENSQSKPKAAVNLTLKPYKSLTQDEIKGIQRLVSASVPQLKEDEVTVLDQDGKILSHQKESESNLILSNQLSKKQALEAYLTSKAEEILNGIFPNNKAFVRVNADVNFDQVRQTTERYLPDSQTKTNDSHGVITHIKQVKINQPSQSVNVPSSDNSTSDIEYKVGNEVKQVIINPGNITHLSVSVVVPEGTNSQTIEQIKNLIANSVGLNTKRGDSISIGALIPLSQNNKAKSIKQLMPETTVISQQPNHTINEFNSKNMLDQLKVMAFKNPSILIVVLLIVILCLFLIFLGISSLFSSKRKLSNLERERLLNDLNQWLAK